MEENKKVSVCMITYAHEKYIREAINGVLMQETTFEFELIISNDCSPDKTDEIINEYISNHPKGKQIKYFSQKQNLGMMPNFIFAMKQCTGKYIALCEGDDYWTDPLKLQKQVDFLEANAAFVLCHHKMESLQENKNKISAVTRNKENQNQISTIEDLAARQGAIIYTASCVFRNGLIKKIPDWFYQAPIGDYPLFLLLAQFGSFFCLNEYMGVYRIHNGGIWSSLQSDERLVKDIKLINLLLTENFSSNVIVILKELQRSKIIWLLKLKSHTNWEEFLIDLKKYSEKDDAIADYWLLKGFPELIALLRNSKSFRWSQKIKIIFKRFHLF